LQYPSPLRFAGVQHTAQTDQKLEPDAQLVVLTLTNV
jgi:hypothetical protein